MTRNQTTPWLLAALFITTAVTLACEPTPGYLERWANTPESEEMFIGFLHDPDVSHEVHVKALELLVDQWGYSASFFANGDVLQQMPDAQQRDDTIRDTLPHVRSLLSEDTTRNNARDALYYFRRGTDNAELIAEIDGMLVEYLNEHWRFYIPNENGVSCIQLGGSVSTQQLFTALGPDISQPVLARAIGEMQYGELSADVLTTCLNPVLRGVEWVATSEPVATALIEVWNGGTRQEYAQLEVTFIEHMIHYYDIVAVRDFFFGLAADDSISGVVKNIVLDQIERNATANDVDRFVALLSSETYTRWSAFKKIVEFQGSTGLELALTSLPTDSEYGFYDGAVRPDGYRNASERIVCTISKLTELGDNARQVFEAHVQDENPYARALSLTCLKTFGDAQTVAALTPMVEELEALEEDAEEPTLVPGFGPETTWLTLTQETLTAINERVNPSEEEGDE